MVQLTCKRGDCVVYTDRLTMYTTSYGMLGRLQQCAHICKSLLCSIRFGSREERLEEGSQEWHATIYPPRYWTSEPPVMMLVLD